MPFRSDLRPGQQCRHRTEGLPGDHAQQPDRSPGPPQRALADHPDQTHVARQMMADGAGRIINMSSIVAATGYRGLSVCAARARRLPPASRGRWRARSASSASP